MNGQRINVTLDGEYAARLSRVALRNHVSGGTMARSLLCSALDQVDPGDGATMTELLDGIPGAFERAERGRRQIEQGQGIPLDQI